MPEPGNVTLVYDGTFDGLLSAVFEAYAGRHAVCGVYADDCVQTGLDRRLVLVPTDETRARRVEAGIKRKIGATAYQTIWRVFWSGDPEKDSALYRYIRTGFELGRRVHGALANDDVRAVEFLWQNVRREFDHMLGFVRFSQMDSGVYYSRIEPKNSLVPLLMPHFADRFSDMPFLLHDAAHGLAGLYDLNGWCLVESHDITAPEPSEQEQRYRRLWRRFYDTIAIRERVSHNRRRTMMPMFYWKNLHELHPRWAETEKSVDSSSPIRHNNVDMH